MIIEKELYDKMVHAFWAGFREYTPMRKIFDDDQIDHIMQTELKKMGMEVEKPNYLKEVNGIIDKWKLMSKQKEMTFLLDDILGIADLYKKEIKQLKNREKNLEASIVCFKDACECYRKQLKEKNG